MRNRLFSFIGIVSLFMLFTGTAFGQETEAPIFSDVTEAHQNFFAIKQLSSNGIIKGYEDGSFRPDQKVTRAESVTLILKSAGLGAEIADKTPTFPDVTKDAWYFTFVEQGAELNIIKGYPSGLFRPENTVFLSEATVMAFRAFGITTGSPTGKEWFSASLEHAEKQNIIDPDDNGAFAPKHEMTRGEMAELLFRVKLAKETGKAFDYSVGWQIFSHPDNYFEIKYPLDWAVFRGTKNNAIWKFDNENDQRWFTRITPNAIRISISFIEDSALTGPNGWFYDVREKQRSVFGDTVKFEERTISQKRALFIVNPENRMFDMYIFLSTGKGLIFYGDYGNSAKNPLFQKWIRAVYQTYVYKEPVPPVPPTPPPLTNEQKIERARQNLLVESAGEDILKLFEDRRIIETDTIGVGTGPVDYFYSALADVTLKYERNSKTLLDLKMGQTTQF